MKILENVRKVPGGLMMVPLVISAVLNTFFPQFSELGNPVAALFSSSYTIYVVGIMLVFAGIQLRPNQILLTLKRGGILVLAKILIGIIFGIIAMNLFGTDGIMGISTLAIVTCITSCNPGMYAALMESFGDEIDNANYALVSLISLPFIPICILGFAGGYGIDYKSIAATCIPFLLGILLGCLDESIREFTKSGTSIMLPFLGLCLGAGINITSAFRSWGLGALLFVIFFVVNTIPMLLIDRGILKQKGHVSAAICCVAGMSIVVPSLMAQADSNYTGYVESATAQLAFVVIISAIVTPALVKYLAGASE